MIFESKRDWWVYLIDILMFLMLIFAAASSESDIDPEYMGFLIALVILLFVNWIIFGTRYIITGDALLVKCGPLRWTATCKFFGIDTLLSHTFYWCILW